MNYLEYEDRDVQAEQQIQALRAQQQYLQDKSTYYKTKWAALGLSNAPIRSLKDLQQFPTTTKADIQLDEAAFLCVPTSEIREYNTTSGTLGQPLSIALSENDLTRLAYNEQLSFESMQVGVGDVVQLMLTLDRQFMAGMAYYAGLRKVGATVVRTGAGLPQLQWDAIFRHQTTTLVAVPSFVLKLMAYADANGIDYQKSSVKKILAIGESLKDGDLNASILAEKITSKWDVELYNTYASTEMQTGFTECKAFAGGHQHTDLIVVEIIDEDGIQVPEGQLGEVCITNLGVEAMPLWRYRTGDIAKLFTEVCTCGRTSPRISGIVGRKNHLLKIKGTSVYPNAVYEALEAVEYVQDYCVEAVLDDNGQDEMVIYIATTHHDLAKVQHETQQFLRSKLKITPPILIKSAAELKALQFPEWSRKPIKFIDKRHIPID